MILYKKYLINKMKTEKNQINDNTMSDIRDLKPAHVWNNFYQLTRQPRPSKHEEKVRAFLLDWGKKHGVETFAGRINYGIQLLLRLRG